MKLNISLISTILVLIFDTSKSVQINKRMNKNK